MPTRAGTGAKPTRSPASTESTISRSATVRASGPIVDRRSRKYGLRCGRCPSVGDEAHARPHPGQAAEAAPAPAPTRRSPSRGRTPTCRPRPRRLRLRSSRRPSACGRTGCASRRRRGSTSRGGRRARRCSSCRPGSRPPPAGARPRSHRRARSRAAAAARPRVPAALRRRSLLDRERHAREAAVRPGGRGGAGALDIEDHDCVELAVQRSSRRARCPSSTSVALIAPERTDSASSADAGKLSCYISRCDPDLRIPGTGALHEGPTRRRSRRASSSAARPRSTALRLGAGARRPGARGRRLPAATRARCAGSPTTTWCTGYGFAIAAPGRAPELLLPQNLGRPARRLGRAMTFARDLRIGPARGAARARPDAAHRRGRARRRS